MSSTLRPNPILLTAMAACLLFASRTVEAQPVRVEAAVDSTATSVRVVLTHSEPASYAVERTEDKLEIHYARPVELREEDEQRFEGEILKRIRLKGDQTVVLATGPAYVRYESFELRNPFRLIIDLQAARSPDTGQSPVEPARLAPRRVIVIDPGHGGIERGAVGPSGLQEKDVTLELCRQLRRLLQQQNPTLGVVLTRDEDRLVGLDERTGIANHNHAELFLSIHLNASPRRGASGAETYFLSNDATDDEARLLAAQENRAAGAGEKATASGGARPDLDLVLWDLAQNQHLADSSRLAESVQGQLNRLAGTRDRGVRQAPFRVLMGATMPAILVEVGFISNPDEEAKLRTPDYRDQVAEAISGAVREFLLGLERSERAPQGEAGAGRP